ncbi:unnamed protein product [Adineta steineri]|uniref:Uncharacterized protein n=1 Tax=Adineta steineri TaxID=433720 RepID=A0A820CM77_9BILA|nr:unnamed protein product [Adineta steineri]
MSTRSRYRSQELYNPTRTLGRRALFPSQSPILQTIISAGPPNRKKAFPELVGLRVDEAFAYLSKRGLRPIIATPDAFRVKEYKPRRVRIETDPSERIVIKVPKIG